MTAGIQVLANSGNVSVDTDSFNFALISKTQVTSGYYRAGPYGNIYGATFNYSGTNPVLAVYSPSGYAAVISTQIQSNGSLTAQIFTGTVAIPLVLYVFDRVPQAPTAYRCGLQVFASDGSMIFDSNYKYMNVRGMITVAGDTSRAASTYAFSAGVTGIQFVQATNGLSKGMFYGYQSVSTGLQCSTLPFDNYPGSYTNLSTSPNVCMLDVTNL